MESTCCPVCLACDAAPAYELTDLAYGNPGCFTLVRCASCGALYQNPRPAQDEIGAYYPREYEPFQRGVQDQRGLRRWLYHQRMKPRCHQVSRLLSTGRLLDIGCANGLFLAEMQRYGDWRLLGVEPDERAATYAREALGLTVFPRLDAAELPAASLDVVTLWDVVEHLHRPADVLTEIARILKPGGWLLVSTPNAASLDAQLFGRFWKGWDAPRHLTVFKPATMQRLLLRCGLRLDRVYSYYGRYTVSALSAQLWLRGKFPDSALRRPVERILFFPLWRWLLLPVYWLVEALGHGSILTYRAQRLRGDHAD